MLIFKYIILKSAFYAVLFLMGCCFWSNGERRVCNMILCNCSVLWVPTMRFLYLQSFEFDGTDDYIITYENCYVIVVVAPSRHSLFFTLPFLLQQTMCLSSSTIYLLYLLYILHLRGSHRLVVLHYFSIIMVS